MLIKKNEAFMSEYSTTGVYEIISDTQKKQSIKLIKDYCISLIRVFTLW